MSDLAGFPNYFNLTGKVALVTGGTIRDRIPCIRPILTVQDRAASACTSRLLCCEPAQRQSSSPRAKPQASTRQLIS